MLRKKVEKETQEICNSVQKACEGTTKLFKGDIENMEKTVRAMRRSRRHFKAKRMMKLHKEELDFQDLISSSENSFAEEDKSGENINNEEEIKPADKSNNILLEPVQAKEEEDECNLPRLALGGVPILENGEPLGATHTEEWVSEYGGASSQESPEFLKYAHNHEAYVNAKDTVEKNVYFIFDHCYNLVHNAANC